MIWIALALLAIGGFALMLWSWPKSLPEADRSRNRGGLSSGWDGYT